jgi:thioester reductase-like protein
MKQIHILLGGTGFLGGFLGNELLENSCKVVFIARSKEGKNAVKRVKENILRVNSRAQIDKIEVLEGDIRRDNWGLWELLTKDPMKLK